MVTQLFAVITLAASKCCGSCHTFSLLETLGKNVFQTISYFYIGEKSVKRAFHVSLIGSTYRTSHLATA